MSTTALSHKSVVMAVPENLIEALEEQLSFMRSMKKRVESGYRRWATADEAAKYMGVSRSTVYHYREQIGYSKLEKAILFDLNDIDRFIESRKLKKY